MLKNQMNWIFPGQVAIVLVYATKLLLASPLVGGSPLILHLTYHSHSLTLTMKHLFIKTLAVKSVAVRFALYTTASYFPVISVSYVGWLIAHHVFLKTPFCASPSTSMSRFLSSTPLSKSSSFLPFLLLYHNRCYCSHFHISPSRHLYHNLVLIFSFCTW